MSIEYNDEKRVISNDRRLYLKIKIKTLVEEAKIIRREEQKTKRKYSGKPVPLESLPEDCSHEDIRLARNRQKAKIREQRDKIKDTTKDYWKSMWITINVHRTEHIRPLLRSANLAYAYIKGIPYKVAESKVREGNHVKNHYRVYKGIIDSIISFGPAVPPMTKEQIAVKVDEWLNAKETSA